MDRREAHLDEVLSGMFLHQVYAQRPEGVPGRVAGWAQEPMVSSLGELQRRLCLVQEAVHVGPALALSHHLLALVALLVVGKGLPGDVVLRVGPYVARQVVQQHPDH